MEQELRKHQIPLFALESKQPLSDFDLIGFTMQHELGATNVLTMLELGGIPLRAADRLQNDPLVIAGGPTCSNPEPMAAFFDAVVLGDGEEVIEQIADAVLQARTNDQSRSEILQALAQLQGVYVPTLFDVDMGADGCISAIRSQLPDQDQVRKASVSDLDAAPFVKKPLVPTVEPVHDRYAVEIQRGCSRGCRFCQAGMIYRPTRQRQPSTIVDLARAGLNASGQETLGLLSLSASDYDCLAPTAAAIFEEHSRRHVSIQLPSLRTEGLDERLTAILNQERKTGFTLAPEAATDRLRRVINKGNTEDDLLRALETVFTAGWSHVKLYFMIGLPTETDEDVAAIIDLARRTRLLGRRHNKAIRITVSVSTFVPKSHTPFQWCRMSTAEEIGRKQLMLKNGLHKFKIAFKWHDKRTSLLEAALSRGDRRLSDVIETAYRNGARFDAWTDMFDLEHWTDAFAAHELEFEQYLSREWSEDQIEPWSHLDYGVTRSFLLEEFKNALQGEMRADCAYSRCTDCGVCDHKHVARRVFARPESEHAGNKHVQTLEAPPITHPRSSGLPPHRVVRFQYSKQDYAVYFGHLDMMSQISRTFRRANIRLKYSAGFHPKPKIGFSPALPLGVSSAAEYFDAEILDASPLPAMVDRLNACLPLGVHIEQARQISTRTDAVSKSIQAMIYSFHVAELSPAPDLAAGLARYMDNTPILFERLSKKGSRSIDLKELVEEVVLTDEVTVDCRVLVRSSGSIKPVEILTQLFGISEDDLPSVRIEKIGVRFQIPSDKSQTVRKQNQIQKNRKRETSNGSETDHQCILARDAGGLGGKRDHG